MSETYTEYGVQRPAPYEGVITDPYYSKKQAKRVAADLNETRDSQRKGEFKAVKRTVVKSDWEDVK